MMQKIQIIPRAAQLNTALAMDSCRLHLHVIAVQKILKLTQECL